MILRVSLMKIEFLGNWVNLRGPMGILNIFGVWTPPLYGIAFYGKGNEMKQVNIHSFYKVHIYEKSSGGILRCMVWGLLNTTPNINDTIKLIFFIICTFLALIPNIATTDQNPTICFLFLLFLLYSLPQTHHSFLFQGIKCILKFLIWGILCFQTCSLIRK